jgi:hypothetical protein
VRETQDFAGYERIDLCPFRCQTDAVENSPRWNLLAKGNVDGLSCRYVRGLSKLAIYRFYGGIVAPPAEAITAASANLGVPARRPAILQDTR